MLRSYLFPISQSIRKNKIKKATYCHLTLPISLVAHIQETFNESFSLSELDRRFSSFSVFRLLSWSFALHMYPISKCIFVLIYTALESALERNTELLSLEYCWLSSTTVPLSQLHTSKLIFDNELFLSFFLSTLNAISAVKIIAHMSLRNYFPNPHIYSFLMSTSTENFFLFFLFFLTFTDVLHIPPFFFFPRRQLYYFLFLICLF